MANYLLVYHGGSMPETEADQAAAMKAWTDWFTALGDALVDGGNPASQTKILAADGAGSGCGGTAPRALAAGTASRTTARSSSARLRIASG